MQLRVLRPASVRGEVHNVQLRGQPDRERAASSGQHVLPERGAKPRLPRAANVRPDPHGAHVQLLAHLRAAVRAPRVRQPEPELNCEATATLMR